MATAFPSRAYPSNRPTNQPSAPLHSQTPFAGASQQPQSNYGGAFGSGPAQQQREAQRLERERAERAERERREAEERGALESLSEEQREEVNEAFALFDLDKDNHIDYHELKVALKALGFDVPKSELLGLLQTHGVPASSLHAKPSSSAQNPDGLRPSFTGPSRLVLSRPAFQTIAAQRIAARDPREEILRAFDLFDQDRKGLISIDDLRRVATELGEGLQEEELQAMIDEFDLTGAGGIGREEFVGICLG